MTHISKHIFKHNACCLIAVLLLGLIGPQALAFQENDRHDEWNQSIFSELEVERKSALNQSPIRSFARQVQSRQLAQSTPKYRSRSEVVQEVKRRYNATVLKISLNQRASVYNVRILTAGGKVRNITVSARR